MATTTMEASTACPLSSTRGVHLGKVSDEFDGLDYRQHKDSDAGECGQLRVHAELHIHHRPPQRRAAREAGEEGGRQMHQPQSEPFLETLWGMAGPRLVGVDLVVELLGHQLREGNMDDEGDDGNDGRRQKKSLRPTASLSLRSSPRPLEGVPGKARNSQTRLDSADLAEVWLEACALRCPDEERREDNLLGLGNEETDEEQLHRELGTRPLAKEGIEDVGGEEKEHYAHERAHQRLPVPCGRLLDEAGKELKWTPQEKRRTAIRPKGSSLGGSPVTPVMSPS